MKATETTTATDAREGCRRHMRELRDDELDAVSGGDCYMHWPRGSNNRLIGD